MATGDEVLEQLSRPQRTVVRVLGNPENWRKVRVTCPDAEGKFCGLTENLCSFENCPKLNGKELNGGEKNESKER